MTENTLLLVLPHDFGSGQKPLYTHWGTQADASKGSIHANSSSTLYQTTLVSLDALLQSLSLDILIISWALRDSCKLTKSSWRISWRDTLEPVMSGRDVETNGCAWTWRTKWLLTQYGMPYILISNSNSLSGECSLRIICFLNSSLGSCPSGSLPCVNRAASTTRCQSVTVLISIFITIL